MKLDIVRGICLSLPGATEDIKWGADLAFSVGGKMFCVVGADPPHPISFKCTAEDFGELVERPGIIPAPYLARAQWVQEQQLGDALERAELERLLRSAYEVVRAKLPAAKRAALTAPVVKPPRPRATSRRRSKPSRRSRG